MSVDVEQHRQHRRLLVALVAAVLAVVVGVGVGVDAHASSPGSQVAGSRVAAHELVAGPVVAASEDVLAGEGRGTTTQALGVAIGSRVAPQATRSLNLPFRDAGLRSQVDDVVRHFDEFGTPPSGVAQGGLKGHPIGTYGNKSGALPQRSLGYYTESDVWMSGAGIKRGAERLILGRGGEVYYSPNHYDSFVRIR